MTSTIDRASGPRPKRPEGINDSPWNTPRWPSAIGEEFALVVRPCAPEQQAARLLDLGLELAIVKMGPAGVLIAWSEGTEQVAPLDIEVVNGLGAGDAFGGALCHGLVLGWDPVTILHFANAAGAFVAARLACADAMPNERQVRELMNDAR